MLLPITQDEIDLLGERTETDEQIEKRIENQEKRIEAIRPAWREFERTVDPNLSDEEVWAEWLAFHPTKTFAAH